MGCRRTAPKGELLRFALARRGSAGAALAVLDSDQRLGGRGAYLCRAVAGDRNAGRRSDLPRSECIAAALRRNGFARALRTKVTLDPKLVESVGR